MIALVAACGAPAQPPLRNVAASDVPARAARARCPERAQVSVAPETKDVGALAGIVLDEACGPIEGVSVIAAAKAYRDTRVEITDQAGRFAFRNLPPGRYEVRLYWLDSTLERDVKIRAGAVEQLEIAMPPEAGKAEPLLSGQSQ